MIQDKIISKVSATILLNIMRLVQKVDMPFDSLPICEFRDVIDKCLMSYLGIQDDPIISSY